MSKRNGKTARSAETQKPSEETKQSEAPSLPSVPSGQSAQVATPQTSAEQQPKVGPLEALQARMLTPATMEKAKLVGLDLQPLLDYATSLEIRFDQVEKAFNHVGVALDKIAPLGDLAEKYKQAQAQQAVKSSTESGSAGGITLKDIKDMLTGAGGGGVDETTKWLAEIGKEQMNMSRIIFSEFAKRIVPDIYEKMAAEATKAAAAKT